MPDPRTTPARRGSSRTGSWNPIAKGQGRFYFPDGKARFIVAPYTPPEEDVDADYPIILTTGRVVSQFLSGTQTRRIGPLVDQYPEPLIEMHPRLAEKLGLADGDWATVESRRGACTLRVQVVTTIRPDTSSSPTTGPGRGASTWSRSPPRTRSPRSPNTRSAPCACARPTSRPRVAPAPAKRKQ